MFDEPSKEHAWLEQLVGQWRTEGECSMGPDKPSQTMTGKLTCRMLGKLWLIGEGIGDGPEGGNCESLMTIGYNPKEQRFVGTFIAAVMAHLWPYHGMLDSSGKRLPLDSEGPKFDGSGMAKYRDTIEIVDKNHWIFSGAVLGDDGTWQPLMMSHNYRIESRG